MARDDVGVKTDALPRKRRPVLRKILFVALGLFVAIQLIPYGHGHSNPPVTQEPTWDSPQTRVLVQTSCFDCHSNQVNWYFYTNVAPFSWLTQHDVEAGRATLNFSEWDLPHDAGAGDVIDAINGGSMPPLVLHDRPLVGEAVPRREAAADLRTSEDVPDLRPRRRRRLAETRELALPRRLEQLADRTFGVEPEEAVHQAHEPPVVRDRDHGSLVALERVFERVGRLDV